MPKSNKQVTDGTLETLISRYHRGGRPISVNFRRLVPWISSIDYGTHLIHPYPAKLLVHIPNFFLSNSILSRPGDTVLDPFCGSGTVLLESILSGRNALGADSNPLARLIARVKTDKLDAGKAEKVLIDLLSRIGSDVGDEPDVVNLEHWFFPHVIYQLRILRTAIAKIVDESVRAFLEVCFSSCVRRVSLADPRLSVPVRLRRERYAENHWLKDKTTQRLNQLKRINVYKQFEVIAEANIKRLAWLEALKPLGKASAPYTDARHLLKAERELAADSVHLIITSPPYAGAQKYIRASSLNMGWLGLCPTGELRRYEQKTVGREHYHKKEYGEVMSTGIEQADRILRHIRSVNPLRSHIMGMFLSEMGVCIKEMHRVLKPSGYMVLVCGSNSLCGHQFRTDKYLVDIATRLKLKPVLRLVDVIKSRGLMTKRNKTAGMIVKEHVIVFQKER